METKRGETANEATPARTEGEAYLTIGEMAREFNVSLRTLRFYEDRGLLHPLRNGVTRLYSGRDRLHLQLDPERPPSRFHIERNRHAALRSGPFRRGRPA